MNIELNELTLDNLGEWPAPIKAALLMIVCLGLLFASYWFNTRTQLTKLSKVINQEQQLRFQFEIKYNQASYFDGYQNQIEEMKKSFGAMLQKLPGKTEVPGLLEDISEIGRANGLQFKLFKPLPEEELEFYAELPIEISVIGDYHQLAKFISDVANLNRIVSLSDFILEPYSEDKNNQKGNLNLRRGYSFEKLLLKITAKTYRYNEKKPTKEKKAK